MAKNAIKRENKKSKQNSNKAKSKINAQEEKKI